MILSWIVASSPGRSRLLEAALEHIRRSPPPTGWTAEVCVGVDAGDHAAIAICEKMSARSFECKRTTGAAKRNLAARAALGALFLIADDDDMQAPDRATLAVAAWEKGYRVTSTREFRYLHLPSGMVVRWNGRRHENGNGGPEPVVGTARNIDRKTFEAVDGFRDQPRQIDSEIQSRITRRFRVLDVDLSRIATLAHARTLWTQTICVQHGKNVWNDRPELVAGRTMRRGEYVLEGEGHWSELADFPASVAQSLGLT